MNLKHVTPATWRCPRKRGTAMPDLLDRILHWVFPTDCAACGRPAAERRLPFFCRGCWQTIRPIEALLAPGAGARSDSPSALLPGPGHLAAPSRKKPPASALAPSPSPYQEILH